MKLNLGSGRVVIPGYTNIDKVQIYNHRNEELVDHVVELEVQKLPFEDNTVYEILADNVFEHIHNLEHVMTECHRVLAEGGILRGCVPIAGSIEDYKDPTHVRHFVKETFYYFYGKAVWDNSRPTKPKYAAYGFPQFKEGRVFKRKNLLKFILTK